MNRRHLLAGIAALAGTALAPLTARAYPDRPIRLVVPFSPGGATDVAGRLWAEKMKPLLGTVVTENRGGGGGVTGAAEVARSQPDGHTFLFGNTSTQVLIPAIMNHPPYDPLKDFVGVYIICNSPTSIVVHESVPARNLLELIAYAKANPTKLSYGSAGVGTMTNLSGELFKQLIGVPDIVHIPYKGSAPGVADLASGHIPMMTPTPPRRQGPHPVDQFHDPDQSGARHPDCDRGRTTRHDRRQSQRPVCSRGNIEGDRRPDRRGDAQGDGRRRVPEAADHLGLRADP
jgi:tripartite-type tricarboxylate transporter receptor subunit TctC